MKHLLPGLKIAQIVANAVIALVGLIVLSLSAHVVAFTLSHTDEELRVSAGDIWGGGVDRTRLHISLTFTYTRPIVLVITGLICLFLHTTITIRWFMRRTLGAVRETKSVHFAILAVKTLALSFTLATTIYCWSVNLHRRGKRHPLLLEWDAGPRTWVNAEAYYDPINWNCALYPVLVDDPGKFRNICHEGHAVLDLLLALPVLQAALLGLYLWTRRRAMTVEVVNTQLKDGESNVYHMDDLQGLVLRSEAHRVEPSRNHKVELSDGHKVDIPDDDRDDMCEGHKVYF